MHFKTFGTITKGGSYPVGLMMGCTFLFTGGKAYDLGGRAYNVGQSPVYSIVILLLLLAGKLGRGA